MQILKSYGEISTSNSNKISKIIAELLSKKHSNNVNEKDLSNEPCAEVDDE